MAPVAGFRSEPHAASAMSSVALGASANGGARTVSSGTARRLGMSSAPVAATRCAFPSIRRASCVGAPRRAQIGAAPWRHPWHPRVTDGDGPSGSLHSRSYPWFGSCGLTLRSSGRAGSCFLSGRALRRHAAQLDRWGSWRSASALSFGLRSASVPAPGRAPATRAGFAALPRGYLPLCIR